MPQGGVLSVQVHSHHPITVVPFFLFFFVVAGVLCVPEMVRSASLRRILYTCTLLEKTRLNEDIFVSQFFFFFVVPCTFLRRQGKLLVRVQRSYETSLKMTGLVQGNPLIFTRAISWKYPSKKIFHSTLSITNRFFYFLVFYRTSRYFRQAISSSD